jgi:drug/metabolite transporter (DMT)-like permease
LITILIWVGWILLTRLGVKTSLSPSDITALRFGTAGLILLPIMIKRGIPWRRVGLRTLAIMIACAGAPYVMVANLGLSFAPAAHAGALMPGIMPLYVAILAFFVLGERPSRLRLVGYAGILLGVMMVAGLRVADALGHGDFSDITIGDGLFLTASFMWASFTIASRGAGLEPLHATSIIATISAAIFLPLYLLCGSSTLLHANLMDIAGQALFQGVFVSVVSLLTYQRAIQLIGPARAAAFGALVPVIAMLSAIPMLGEIPTLFDAAGIVLISAGVFLATRA